MAENDLNKDSGTSNNLQQGLLSAGDIEIVQAVIINQAGQEYDVKLFIGELNIFEDMYRPGMYGNLLVIDANNLSNIIGLIGDEYLRLALVTPTMEALIFKTFKIYSITDRQMISDSGKQSYLLHFCSPEIFIDILSPIYQTWSGKIDDVVSRIYSKHISTSRYGADEPTQLVILGATDNEVKFTSPGWRPFHCINWLASRAVAQGYKNPGYLFYESNKAYYFANVEALMDLAIKDKSIYQWYSYGAFNLNGNEPEELQYMKDIDRDYAKIEEMQVVQNFNQLKNAQNGYLANRLITLDMLSKDYQVYDYDHVSGFDDYKHLENIGGISNSDCAPFSKNALRSPAGMVNFYPRHQYLYNGFKDNVADVIEKTLPRRISTLNELTNFKIEITVPGRTDVEVGAVVGLLYPDASPRDESDKTNLKTDELYTGYYLITAIRHKITLQKHMMILELVKDSLKRRPGA